MTQFLPPNLLSLFFPRDPLPYKAPPAKKKCPQLKRYNGVSEYLDHFEEHKEVPPVIYETRFERRERKLKERKEHQLKILEERKSKWDPKNDTNLTSDPYKTLFLGRLSYETTEARLRHDFEIYGPIKNIVIVKNKFTDEPRGYAFIEYEHTRDMHAAYKHMDGKKMDGRRIVVDAERGRTERNWLPRYLGGGLGGTKRATRTRRPEKVESQSRNNNYESEREHSTYDRGQRGRPREYQDHRRREFDNRRDGYQSGYQDRDRQGRRNNYNNDRRYQDDYRRRYDRERRY